MRGGIEISSYILIISLTLTLSLTLALSQRERETTLYFSLWPQWLILVFFPFLSPCSPCRIGLKVFEKAKQLYLYCQRSHRTLSGQ